LSLRLETALNSQLSVGKGYSIHSVLKSEHGAKSLNRPKENIFAPTSTEDPQHEENLLGDVSTLLDMVVPMRIVVMTPNPLLVDMKGTLIGSTPDPNVMYSYENNATEDNYCGLHSSAECGLMVFGTFS
jgi:hypothetical protein